MLVIAVTGGIGAGKSEATRRFESLGAVVLDLDSMAKDLLEPGTDVYEAVVAAFGDDVVGPEGTIVNSRLADAAFCCDATAVTLSAIVHPPVVSEVGRTLEDFALQARPPRVVVMEVPLLVENPELQRLADIVVNVEAPEDIRLSRLVDRGMSEADARSRMARQGSDEERREIADATLANDGDMAAFAERLTAFWESEIAPRLEGPAVPGGSDDEDA